MKTGRLVLSSLLCLTVIWSCAGGKAQKVNWPTAQRSELSASYSQFLVGRFASLTNHPEKAAVSYAAALRASDGQDPALTERTVFSLLLSGDVDRASRVAGRAKPEALASASLARLTHGIHHLRKGRSEDAAVILSAGEFGPFNDLVAEGVAAWAALDADGLTAAEARLQLTPGGDPLIEGLKRSTLALLKTSLSQDESAIADFERVRALGVRFAFATEYHARLLAVSGRNDEALELLNHFRASAGHNAGVDLLYRDLAAGRPVTLQRPSISEGAALAVYAPAAALAAQTSGDVAGVYFALALGIDPELDAARALWADALDNAGRRDEAIALLEEIDPVSPFYSTAQGQIAWALRRKGQDAAALQIAQGALRNRPDRDLKVQLGDLLRSLEKHDDAERVFSEIIEADERAGRSDWRLYFARANQRQALGLAEASEADLVKALELSPDQPELLNHLGYSWVDQGRNLQDAFRMIKRAVELRPRSGFIVDSLGWAYYRLGQYDQAVVHLERAIELEPGDPVLNDHLGDAYWRVGRRLEAGFQWRRSLRVAPDQSNAETIQAKLDNGLDAVLAGQLVAHSADP